jgi:cell wall assembly regulator SMI1
VGVTAAERKRRLPARVHQQLPHHTGQRQSDPATRHLSIASIRELQAAWLALGLHERQAPDQILARRFPTGDDDWRAQRVRGFAARRVSG